MTFTLPTLSEEDERAMVKADRSRRGRSSSAKGAGGEREVLNAFRDVMRNVEAELVEQGHAIVARSDFATRKRIERGTSNRDIGNIPIISIEVKRNETLNLSSAWEQTLRQANNGLLPVLCYRFNREAWRVRTWAALTHYDGRSGALKYAVAEVSLPDFLAYFRLMYQDFLTREINAND